MTVDGRSVDPDAVINAPRGLSQSFKYPKDSDDNGLYEDINGDGTAGVVDVQALFRERDDEQVLYHQSEFDFNNDGQVNVIDVQALFSRFF